MHARLSTVTKAELICPGSGKASIGASSLLGRQGQTTEVGCAGKKEERDAHAAKCEQYYTHEQTVLLLYWVVAMSAGTPRYLFGNPVGSGSKYAKMRSPLLCLECGFVRHADDLEWLAGMNEGRAGPAHSSKHSIHFRQSMQWRYL
jgi:hypothetical protein